MQILRHTRHPPADAQGAVVALGNFDGVHLGHQALLRQARALARAENRPFAALVFEPNPREYFRPQDPPFRLTPFRVKAQLLADEGVDVLIVLAFDAAMAGRLAQDFVLDILVGDLRAAHIVVGADFRFGKNRGGDTAVLSYMGEMEDFGVTTVQPIVMGGNVAGENKISSSDIRTALKEGRPQDAARLLGHWWRIEAHVAHGDKRGRTIGFPTANLKLDHTLHPLFGVYAVRAWRQGKETPYDGVANFGIRPMFALSEPLLEIHLFDFADEIYGEVLSVELIAYLRGELKMDSLEALQAQIAADAAEARRVLSQAGPKP